MKWLTTTESGFPAAFEALLDEARQTTAQVDGSVAAIIAAIRAKGDEALCAYTAQFDGHSPTPATLRVTQAEIDNARAAIAPDLAAALDLAATRIEAFHRAQMPVDMQMHDDAGVTMGLRWGALDAIGIYVPGGRAAYPSSVLMNALPARVAGVPRIAMCVPCPGGVLNPLVLAAADRAGVTEIFRVGGAQAIAALAYGTATIAPVDRIVGPGNAYVAEAKRQVFGHVGIDGVAGPSEVVILADAATPPRLVAIDLLAQAEHDDAAQSILITTDRRLRPRRRRRGGGRAPHPPPRSHCTARPGRPTAPSSSCATGPRPPRSPTASHPNTSRSCSRSRIAHFAAIRHAGAAFLGPHAPEALGDYIAGPNHVLPTGRTARYASGLSVLDCLKRTSWVRATADSLREIGPAAVLLAEAEGLTAHARSLAMRLGQ